MTSLSGWPASPLPNLPKDAPLWRRTQRRLQRMGTFTAQRTSFDDSCDPVIQAMESAITAQSELLVQLLRRWEERQEAQNDLVD